VHPNEKRQFAETNRAGVELRGGEEKGGGSDQAAITSGAFHSSQVLPSSVEILQAKTDENRL
jgi:hypothetical protein